MAILKERGDETGRPISLDGILLLLSVGSTAKVDKSDIEVRMTEVSRIAGEVTGTPEQKTWAEHALWQALMRDLGAIFTLIELLANAELLDPTEDTVVAGVFQYVRYTFEIDTQEATTIQDLLPLLGQIYTKAEPTRVTKPVGGVA